MKHFISCNMCITLAAPRLCLWTCIASLPHGVVRQWRARFEAAALLYAIVWLAFSSASLPTRGTELSPRMKQTFYATVASFHSIESGQAVRGMLVNVVACLARSFYSAPQNIVSLDNRAGWHARARRPGPAAKGQRPRGTAGR
jgi:hypothetical protein